MATLTRRVVGSPLTSDLDPGEFYLGPRNEVGIDQYNAYAGSAGSGGNGQALNIVASNPLYSQIQNGTAQVTRIFVNNDGSVMQASGDSIRRDYLQSAVYNQRAPLTLNKINATVVSQEKSASSNLQTQVKLFNSTKPGSQVGEMDGPFATTRVTLGGTTELISKADRAAGYSNLVPGLYNQYVSGQITGSQLFSRATTQLAKNDKDTINNSGFKVTLPSSFQIRFPRSGGSSYGSFSSGRITIR